MTGLQVFGEQYRMELHKAVNANPNDFPWWPNTSIDTVADRMIEAFRKGSFNKDSKSIKAVCKSLGIKHTYAAMQNYFVKPVS